MSARICVPRRALGVPNSVRLVTGVGRPPLPGDAASILAHENSAEYDWLLENAAVIVERERERRNREDRQLLDVRYPNRVVPRTGRARRPPSQRISCLAAKVVTTPDADGYWLLVPVWDGFYSPRRNLPLIAFLWASLSTTGTRSGRHRASDSIRSA